jgi:hypothetical protein
MRNRRWIKRVLILLFHLQPRILWGLTNQGNRRASVAPNDAMVRAFASREKPRRWRVRVDRVVRARGATTAAKGGQKHRGAALPWERWAHYANSAAVSHDRDLTRDALRLSLRCREDRPNVPVSQG